jgi:hypothetical protein
MSDRTNHRRVLHFAVTGVLLGAVGCTGNEPPKGEAKPVEKEPEMEFAPNPGPNERNGLPPEVAPTTAVKEPPPVEDIDVNEGPVKEPPVEEDHVNEGPVKEPEPAPKPVIEKRVNTGPVKEPEPKPQIKVNPGPA